MCFIFTFSGTHSAKVAWSKANQIIASHFQSQSQKYNQNAQGSESASPFQIKLPTALYPARDLQRLNSLIFDHIKQLDKLNTVGVSLANMATKTWHRHVKRLRIWKTSNWKQINARYKSALWCEKCDTVICSNQLAMTIIGSKWTGPANIIGEIKFFLWKILWRNYYNTRLFQHVTPKRHLRLLRFVHLLLMKFSLERLVSFFVFFV